MAKGKSKKVEKNPIAYVIKDNAFGEFQILNSENAWWLIREKVELFIAACKFDATLEECCAYTGISMAQYRYFSEQHPYFSQVKAACNELPNLKARERVVKGLNESFNNAFTYLERKKKKEFSPRFETDITSGGEPLVLNNDQLAKIARRIVDGNKPSPKKPD